MDKIIFFRQIWNIIFKSNLQGLSSCLIFLNKGSIFLWKLGVEFLAPSSMRVGEKIPRGGIVMCYSRTWQGSANCQYLVTKSKFGNTELSLKSCSFRSTWGMSPLTSSTTAFIGRRSTFMRYFAFDFGFCIMSGADAHLTVLFSQRYLIFTNSYPYRCRNIPLFRLIAAHFCNAWRRIRFETNFHWWLLGRVCFLQPFQKAVSELISNCAL